MRALVEEIYAAFGRGDLPTILERLSDDVRWEVAGRPSDYPMIGAWRGRLGATEFFTKLAATENITRFEPRRFHVGADSVVVEGWAEVALVANGRRAAYDWIHIWDVARGQVTRFKEFYDTAQVAEAHRG